MYRYVYLHAFIYTLYNFPDRARVRVVERAIILIKHGFVFFVNLKIVRMFNVVVVVVDVADNVAISYPIGLHIYSASTRHPAPICPI